MKKITTLLLLFLAFAANSQSNLTIFNNNGQQFYVIKRNPTPGSPAYEELQAKRAKDGRISATDALGAIESEIPLEAPKPAQRKQPKKGKKKK